AGAGNPVGRNERAVLTLRTAMDENAAIAAAFDCVAGDGKAGAVDGVEPVFADSGKPAALDPAAAVLQLQAGLGRPRDLAIVEPQLVDVAEVQEGRHILRKRQPAAV